MLNRLIKRIFEGHNTGSYKEVSEEDDKEHCPDDGEVIIVPHQLHGVLLTHHCNNLHLHTSDKTIIFLYVRTYKHIGKEGEAQLTGQKQHHEVANHSEGFLNNTHDPVNQPEDSHGTDEIINVENDDQSVHLVLLHVVVSEVHELNILLCFISKIVIIQNPIKVMIVSPLGEDEFDSKEENDK